ncbi:iron complex outermembrane receptor protein [Sphingomonas vulcanisoli]|uniref:Iron complex outermembrane receptor protein n=1 Tax=Sphingomonas vulcanisoli TaxID=1658060 RepID=A0ABX0TW02_9SPHN|nr:TonB-dependent receptor [Sphingomonas vulcanisoli]NIJ09621.1 iron complex outermembrane receptor protein [Sphingomonas vulcanisoli]
MASPALAQQATDQAAASQSAIQDIVVTAQRRSESVQKTSISLSVLSPEAIAKANISQAQNLAQAVVGLQIGQGGPATQIYIRGVGDFGSTASTNPAVAFNVDGVYVPRPAAIEGNFYDLERVEVLKGPQGTLYGRNATGGAINVITAKPKLGVTAMRGSIEIGNYRKIGADAAVNFPLGETVAVRFAAQVVNRGPYVTYGFDDEVRQSGRGQLLWKPNSALSIRLSGDYTHVGGGGAAYVVVPSAPGAAIASPKVSPWTSATDPVYANYVNALSVASNRCGPRAPGSPFAAFPFSGACPNVGPFTQAQLTFGSFGQRGAQNNVFWNVSAQLDYDFGFATLTLLPAYRKASLDYLAFPGVDTRFDSSAAGVPETSKAKSFEARLAHDSSVLKWVIGGYYFREKQFAYSQVTSGYLQNVIINQVIGSKAFAGFGQATYSVTDRFRVIGGARYTSDNRTGEPQSVNIDPSLGFAAAIGGSLAATGTSCAAPVYPSALGNTFVGCANPRLYGDKTFRKVNWKAGVEYDLTPRNMVYATASTGFKAGGIYAGKAIDGSAASYNPENLTAYEIGSRNRFFNNKLQLNFEGFYYDYKDHQEPVIVLDAAGLTTQAIQNAGSGRLYGASADVVYKPTRHDTLHFGVEYLNSKYTRFALSSPLIVGTPTFLPDGASGCPITSVFNAAGAGLTLPPTGVGVGTGPGGAILPGYARGAVVGSQTQSCVGKPFTRSPRWSGLISYTHVFDLGDSGQIEAEGNMQFQSSRYLGTEYLPSSLAPAYQQYNASLTYDAPGGHLSVTAYIRNITNEAIYTATARSFSIVGLNGASIAPPRTYGGRLSFNF